MSITAICSGDHEVVITGTLSNLRPHADGGVTATLAHPEAQVRLVIPAGVPPIGSGRRVTVGGVYAGSTIRVEAVSAR
ncbi:hypothetical protein ACQP2Y_21345 [Actinoplanes sp. CA-051413]|uniref:hypothetical protein n=1 Tax=Actinoplanes sp. CA-051413 TaxID=3239899 RepID=UPI003D9886D9